MSNYHFAATFTVVLAVFGGVVIGKVRNQVRQSTGSFEYSSEELSNNFTKKGEVADYFKEVQFKYYKNGQLTYVGNGVNAESMDQTGCLISDNFAFIVHGWQQNCDTEWVPMLISKLTTFRGGCIVCIDYGSFAQGSYVRLLRQFDSLSNVMSEKVKYLETQGLNPHNTLIFGFSYGGQLATAIGKKVGPGRIREIDTCDMAGPGFDIRASLSDHRSAAQNVQCIHTTRDKGTRYYNCHQNWRMGNCGFSQAAAKDPPRGSHGLCPYFYISAFEHEFFAIRLPDKCNSRKPAPFWPQNFKMGYMEPRKHLVSGELFADTGNHYPYNVIPTVMYQSQVQPQQNYNDRPILNSIIKAGKFLRGFH